MLKKEKRVHAEHYFHSAKFQNKDPQLKENYKNVSNKYTTKNIKLLHCQLQCLEVTVVGIWCRINKTEFT